MNLPTLLVSDLHLTAKPRDEYRWELFDWLHDQIYKHQIKTVVILGDVTDAKDFHGSDLVNRVALQIHALSLKAEVVILKGNHDYLKDGKPFFQFLELLPNISFMDEITPWKTNVDVASLFLPHCKNPHEQWRRLDFEDYDYVFMHQTVNASIASNGQKMQGELEGNFHTKPIIQIYSGDIHVPQDVGNVRYVGSPYHVHFGDKFEPRCIVIDKECRETNIYFKTLNRVTLSGTQKDIQLAMLFLKHGDQVKLRVELESWDRSRWDTVRRELTEFCANSGVELYGCELLPHEAKRITPGQAGKVAAHTDPTDTVTSFVQREDLGGDILETGLGIIQR